MTCLFANNWIQSLKRKYIHSTTALTELKKKNKQKKHTEANGYSTTEFWYQVPNALRNC